MGVVYNTSNLDVDVGGQTQTVPSNQVQVAIVDLFVQKTVSNPWTIEGGTVDFCNAITNATALSDGGMTIQNAIFRDVLEPRVEYVVDTFTVDGIQQTPTISGQTISYTIPTLDPEQTINICFTVKMLPD